MALSVFRLAQSPLQLERPAWHETAHFPPEQTEPAAHTVPHPPQLSTSFAVFVQVPLQVESPAWHVSPHLPPEQT